MQDVTLLPTLTVSYPHIHPEQGTLRDTPRIVSGLSAPFNEIVAPLIKA
jgi:hypothetical protein